MVNKYFEGKVEYKAVVDLLDKDLIDSINSLESRVTLKMDCLEIGLAIDEIFQVLRKCNKYIDDTMPWVLAKNESERDRLQTVLYQLLEAIRVCAWELSPFLPDTSKEILRQLGLEANERCFEIDHIYIVNEPIPLFQRIDISKKLEEIGM